MSDLLKLVLDADDGADRWRDIKAVTLTVKVSSRIEIDGASRVVKVSYRREVVQIIEGSDRRGDHHQQLPSADQEDNQTCIDL